MPAAASMKTAMPIAQMHQRPMARGTPRLNCKVQRIMHHRTSDRALLRRLHHQLWLPLLPRRVVSKQTWSRRLRLRPTLRSAMQLARSLQLLVMLLRLPLPLLLPLLLRMPAQLLMTGM